MRCIETIVKGACVVPCGMINYNMRCIETWKQVYAAAGSISINYNMRCIETRHFQALRFLALLDKLQHEMY